MKTFSSLPCLLGLASLLALPLGSRAATYVVTSLNDSGPGSLRDAVDAANANANADVITFDTAFSGQLIMLGSQLLLSNQVTIDASGLANGLTITTVGGAASSGNSRIFEVAENAAVELNHLAIVGGYAVDGAAGTNHLSSHGGGILVNADGGTLTLDHCTLAFNYALVNGGAIAMMLNSDFVVTLNHCTVAHNAAGEGGGIFRAGGQLTLNHCNFTGNTATGQGGGIHGACTVNNSSIHNNVALRSGGGISGGLVIANNSTIANNFARFGGGMRTLSGNSLNNCTVSGNVAHVGGGGIENNFPSGDWVNSIVAGNTAPSNSNFRRLASVVSNSLTDGNPLLASLGNYGGPTLTMPPLAGSPALDAGANSVTNFLATDQRGYTRLSGAQVDIGAVERQIVSATNAPVLKLTFASSPDTDFTVRAATDAALPAAQWSILGPATQNPPGQYLFTDIFAPDYPRRFYKVTSP